MKRTLDERLKEVGIRYTWNDNGKVVFADSGLILDPQQGGPNYCIDLIKSCKARFTTSSGKTFISMDDTVINLETAEELFIIHEIFFKRIYNVLPSRKSILIDIGMNVGIATLFFALNQNIVSIFAFEPNKESFDQANYNFSLNKNFLPKISAFNVGLGECDRVVDVEFDPQNKGQLSIDRRHPGLKTNDPMHPLRKTKVQIKDTLILNQILESNKQYSKVVKMDCEGSEYEILKRMAETGTLGAVDVVILEWHFRGPEELIRNLDNNGYQIICQHIDCESGLIYAFRRQCTV